MPVPPPNAPARATPECRAPCSCCLGSLRRGVLHPGHGELLTGSRRSELTGASLHGCGRWVMRGSRSSAAKFLSQQERQRMEARLVLERAGLWAVVSSEGNALLPELGLCRCLGSAARSVWSEALC